MNFLRRNIYILLLTSLLVSCSTTKYVGENEYLLDKVEIVSDKNVYKSSDLKSYLRQQPNLKVFGFLKAPLYVYGWSGRNDKKWINRQLKKLGEPPVILDTLLVQQSASELERFFVNKGYVNAEVDVSIDTSRVKKALVTYNIKENEPYRIRNYSMNLSQPALDSIARLKPRERSAFANAFHSSQDEYNTLVHPGALFDRDMLEKERQRITTLLRRRGYYAFNRDNLAYVADSSLNSRQVDLDMYLKPYRKVLPDGSVVEVPHVPYYINDITVVIAQDLSQRALRENDLLPRDTVEVDGIKIVYPKGKQLIRPKALRNAIYMTPGRRFNERSIDQTYASFAALGALKNINIRFSEFEELDTMKLDCEIMVMPSKLQGVGFEVEGTNSSGDFGFASSLSYQHRNLFHGSELFSAKVRGAYESLSGSNERGLQNYWELGVETSIRFPRFIFPFLSESFKRKIRASTELKLSYNMQTRPEYERAIVSGGWSYIWQDRNNSLARHTIRLIDIDYVYLPRINSAFKDLLPESIALYNYSDQFIMSTGYTYSFNNYSPQNRQRNTHSLRVSLETAGNLLHGLSRLAKSKKNENGHYELFGIDFSQFVKADVDFSKSIVLDSRNKIAFHVGVGIGFPYGNTEMLPFERRYFSGGANSVRGWSVRELGPGSMPLTDSTTFALQAGDIRLDLNLEYRTKLFWKFELAAFIDAGNIWTIRNYEDQPNGNFDFSRFYKEIAVSYGLGIRLDFDFFLLRFDMGMKAYNPQETGKRKWAITRPNFHDNFAWHFAVGYPF